MKNSLLSSPLLSSPLLVAAALAISLGGGTAYATPTTQADVFITQSPNIGDTSSAVAEDHDPALGTQSGTSRAFAQFVSNDTLLFGSGNGVADTNGAIYARGTVNLTFGNIGILQADGGAETVYDETVTSSGPVHAYLDFVIPTLELSAIHQAFAQVFGYAHVYINGSPGTNTGLFYTATFDGTTQTLTQENKNPGGFTTFTQYDFSCTTSCANINSLTGFLDLGVLNNGDILSVDYVLNARANAGSDNSADPSTPSPNASAVFGDPSCVATNLSSCERGSASLRFVPIEVTGSIPEPMTLGLMSLGLAGLGFSRRRRA